LALEDGLSELKIGLDEKSVYYDSDEEGLMLEDILVVNNDPDNFMTTKVKEIPMRRMDPVRKV